MDYPTVLRFNRTLCAPIYIKSYQDGKSLAIRCRAGNKGTDSQHCIQRRNLFLLPLLTIGNGITLSYFPNRAAAKELQSRPVIDTIADVPQTPIIDTPQNTTSLTTGTAVQSQGSNNGEGNVERARPESSSQTPSPSDDTSNAITTSKVPRASQELSEEAAKKLLEEEEDRRRARRRGKGRIRELEEIRAELAEKELVLLEKEQELLAEEQTVMVLREELEIERKLRTLLTKEKEKAEEEAALAMGLCMGGSMLP